MLGRICPELSRIRFSVSTVWSVTSVSWTDAQCLFYSSVSRVGSIWRVTGASSGSKSVSRCAGVWTGSSEMRSGRSVGSNSNSDTWGRTWEDKSELESDPTTDSSSSRLIEPAFGSVTRADVAKTAESLAALWNGIYTAGCLQIIHCAVWTNYQWTIMWLLREEPYCNHIMTH